MTSQSEDSLGSLQERIALLQQFNPAAQSKSTEKKPRTPASTGNFSHLSSSNLTQKAGIKNVKRPKSTDSVGSSNTSFGEHHGSRSRLVVPKRPMIAKGKRSLPKSLPKAESLQSSKTYPVKSSPSKPSKPKPVIPEKTLATTGRQKSNPPEIPSKATKPITSSSSNSQETPQKLPYASSSSIPPKIPPKPSPKSKPTIPRSTATADSSSPPIPGKPKPSLPSKNPRSRTDPPSNDQEFPVKLKSIRNNPFLAHEAESSTNPGTASQSSLSSSTITKPKPPIPTKPDPKDTSIKVKLEQVTKDRVSSGYYPPRSGVKQSNRAREPPADAPRVKVNPFAGSESVTKGHSFLRPISPATAEVSPLRSISSSQLAEQSSLASHKSISAADVTAPLRHLSPRPDDERNRRNSEFEVSSPRSPPIKRLSVADVFGSLSPSRTPPGSPGRERRPVVIPGAFPMPGAQPTIATSNLIAGTTSNPGRSLNHRRRSTTTPAVSDPNAFQMPRKASESTPTSPPRPRRHDPSRFISDVNTGASASTSVSRAHVAADSVALSALGVRPKADLGAFGHSQSVQDIVASKEKPPSVPTLQSSESAVIKGDQSSSSKRLTELRQPPRLPQRANTSEEYIKLKQDLLEIGLNTKKSNPIPSINTHPAALRTGEKSYRTAPELPGAYPMTTSSSSLASGSSSGIPPPMPKRPVVKANSNSQFANSPSQRILNQDRVPRHRQARSVTSSSGLGPPSSPLAPIPHKAVASEDPLHARPRSVMGTVHHSTNILPDQLKPQVPPRPDVTSIPGKSLPARRRPLNYGVTVDGKTVPTSACRRYEKLFHKADVDQVGWLSSEVVRSILVLSRLDQATLSGIWEKAIQTPSPQDAEFHPSHSHGQGYFGWEQFCAALHFTDTTLASFQRASEDDQLDLLAS